MTDEPGEVDYSNEDRETARRAVQAAIDELKLTVPPPHPAAVAEAFANLAGAMWGVAFDDPGLEKLQAYLIETRAAAKRLDTVRKLNPER